MVNEQETTNSSSLYSTIARRSLFVHLLSLSDFVRTLCQLFRLYGNLVFLSMLL